MRSCVAVCLLCSICLFTISAHAQSPANFFDNRADVEQWISDNKDPALGIGIIREGELREIRMYGNISKDVPAPYNAIFNVASLTKPVVAMLALKLVSNGSWSLDESLSNYWVDPDIANDPRHKKITTRIVLSHQTGFKNWRYMKADGKLTIDFEPGTKNGYSGEGFEYLRKSLENKFKMSLDKLADSLLFSPLGMTDTRFKWDEHTDESRFAHWFDTSGNEIKRDYKLKATNAADDLLTTIEDYGRFSAFILKGAGLDTSIYNQMIHPHVATQRGLHMGLGWELFSGLGPKKQTALVHSGSDTGVKTLVILLPESKQGLIIFTNGDNGWKLYERVVVELLEVGREMMGKR